MAKTFISSIFFFLIVFELQTFFSFDTKETSHPKPNSDVRRMRLLQTILPSYCLN